MREIKFRAWQKHTTYLPDNAGTMWQPGELLGEDLIVTFTGNVMEKYQDSGFGETWESYRDVSDSYVLMQYTGLKDKNGKEIYEGDIVSRAGHVSTIEYRAGMFGMNNAKSDRRWGYRPQPGKLFPITGGIEVIGNIWENPELLEAEL